MSSSPSSSGSAGPSAAELGISLRNQAYERFRQEVLASRLKPGQFVSQQELTLLLGMPLGAVREMIPRLEAARLITTVPKRGLQIAPVNLKLIRNAFHVRSMIELEATAHFVRHAREPEIEGIAAQHRAILVRASKPGPDKKLDDDALAVDWGLHNRMVDGMGNEILSDMYRVNNLHIKLIRIDSAMARPMRVVPAMQEHLAFLEAVQARQEKRAIELMTAHIEASRQRVLARASGLEQVDEPQAFKAA
jgi:DNA-binding GntR family transcriptional regulator